MSKRLVCLAVGALLLVLSCLADAQQSQKVLRIGWIEFSGSAPGRSFANFLEGLREHGYIERQNTIIEFRSGEGRDDRLAEVAAELVRLKVDVIVADTNAATRAAQKATKTIPIVFIYGDPVGDGLVKNLAHPGGNLTGLSFFSLELSGKRLEMLKEAVPKTTRVAVLYDPDAQTHLRQLKEMGIVAQALGVQLQPLELRDSKLDFERLFQQAINQRANALLILPNPTVGLHRTRLFDLAAKNRLPAMYPHSRFSDAGGLMSYGPNLPDQYRRLAYFVDRIFKGAKPAELPVEQPTKFELVINLKTAKALGLTIPSNVLVWADRVIGHGGQMPEKTMATTYSSESQRRTNIPRIGVLSPGCGGPGLNEFRQGLRDFGYGDGQNIIIEYRCAEGDDGRLPALAAELLRMNVHIIVATNPRSGLAAQRLTSTIPIVVAGIGNPVGGLVKSTGELGENVTGSSFMASELGGKRLELLKEIIPRISRVAILANVINGNPAQETSIKEVDAVARSLGVQLQILNVKNPDEIQYAFSAMVKGKARALTVLTQGMFVINRTRIVELAAK